MRKLSYKKIAIFCIVLYACFTLVSQQVRIAKQKSSIDDYSSQLQQAQEKNSELQDEIKLSTDNSYIEKLAREKLGLIREGEAPVIDSN